MAVKRVVKHSVKRSVKHSRGTVGLSGAFVKDMMRCWARGWKRFLSIAIISMLGVAVLTGIYAGCRDMFRAADRFYDAQQLHDIQVLSTYGLTDDDVAALKRVEGVGVVQPERTQSVTTEVNGTAKSVTMTELGVEGLDMPYVQDGDMPSKAGEVAVTEKFLLDSGLSIGDHITVTPKDDQTTAAADTSVTDDNAPNAADTANATDTDGEEAASFPTELTITAQVLDPKDLTNPTGYSTAAFRSPTTADYIFFTPSEGVTGTVYSAISITVDTAADHDSFSDDYEALVNDVAERIENTVQDDRQSARRQSIVSRAQETLDAAKADAMKQLDDAQRQIDEQSATLASSQAELESNRATLDAKQREISSGETQIATARAQITAGRLQITQGRQQISEARTQLNSGKAQLTAARAQLDTAQQQLNANLSQVNQGIAQVDQMLGIAQQAQDMLNRLPTVDPIDLNVWANIVRLLEAIGIHADPASPPGSGLASLKQQVADTAAQMQAQREQLQSNLDQIASGQSQLDEQNAQLTAKEQEVAAGEAQLNQQASELEAKAGDLEAQAVQLETQAAQLASGKQQLEDGKNQLNVAQSQLDDGMAQLNEAQAELDAQRQNAEDEFAKQQQTIDDIAGAQWYVQTRSSIGGVSSLESDVSSIESIGLAFPVVFLLVAVLMSLTCMTRMVEEERGLIGTYTGLGYGSLAIASRYVLFAVLASLVGGALGLLLGFLGIPAFLLLVLKDMYVIPDIRLEYDWITGSGGVALFVIGILAATAVACAGELKQTPAELMRPKAPKAGARVLLERIAPLWKRLGFLNKVTVRNIFRFKSRLIMTVGGVAGCTALIVCGLAINDSVDTLAAKQYDDIYHYDLMLVASDDTADQMRERVEADGKADRTMDLRIESGEMEADGGSETIQLMIVPESEADDLTSMISLRNASDTRDTVTLGDDGIIVSQSAAKAMNVEAGDVVALTDGQMRHGEAQVAAVSRNLIGSDVYISNALYDQVFGNEAPLTLNAMLATLKGDADANIAYADELSHDPAVLSSVSCDDMQRSFTFELMGAVVGLIVALAGSLALVVLFTLSNTNVSERVREMATLKVLGFFDREVHTYVNKEMMILTGMGIAVGLPLGRWIGGLLTAVLNMPSIYFEVEVHWWSYLIAAGATLVFALLVQLFVNPVLDRIDPVSSLKSVE